MHYLPEFDLMKKMVRSNTKLIGTDQISIRAEGLLAAQLKEQTQSEKISPEGGVAAKVKKTEEFPQAGLELTICFTMSRKKAHQ